MQIKLASSRNSAEKEIRGLSIDLVVIGSISGETIFFGREMKGSVLLGCVCVCVNAVVCAGVYIKKRVR